MSYSIGLVGLPNVGKSTLFNAITKQSVPAENYPFCTIDPAVGTIAVPDERLERLTSLSSSSKTLPAAIEVTDIAGLVKGASKGEGLGNEFLSHIREVDAIAHIVRIFENPKITHVDGKEDPLRDIETIHTELILADIQYIDKRRISLKKKVAAGVKDDMQLDEVLQKAHKHLLTESFLRNADLTSEEMALIKKEGLITIKPIMFILNFEAAGKNIHDDNEVYEAIEKYMEKHNHVYTLLDAFFESLIAESNEDEQKDERQEVGVLENGIHDFIQKAYTLLGLITFFTTGEKETRAWTIERDSTAPIAGAAIHTDFRDKFIRVEVVSYKDFLECGSYARAREEGKIRIEGKEYVVQDGDILNFKI